MTQERLNEIVAMANDAARGVARVDGRDRVMQAIVTGLMAYDHALSLVRETHKIANEEWPEDV
jgi:hypothetical protein